MVLVCLSPEHGLYRIEDEMGHMIVEPFHSVADPATMAQRLANTQRRDVRLVVWPDGDHARAECSGVSPHKRRINDH